MWKDLLQAETARREQADEDAEKLREEVRKLKEQNAAISSNSTHHSVRNIYNINNENMRKFDLPIDIDIIKVYQGPLFHLSSTLFLVTIYATFLPPNN